jgi:hypothetical protein
VDQQFPHLISDPDTEQQSNTCFQEKIHNKTRHLSLSPQSKNRDIGPELEYFFCLREIPQLMVALGKVL